MCMVFYLVECNTAFLVKIETEKCADRQTDYHLRHGHCHDHCQDYRNPHDHHHGKIGQRNLATVSAKSFSKVAGRLEKSADVKTRIFS